jgi:hypothetical protein
VKLVVLLLLFLASAPNVEASQVFPIRSGICGDPRIDLISQAFVFTRAGESYALASDQGSYNNSAGETGICAAVSVGGAEQRARLIAHDPGAGLALYRLEKQIAVGDFPETSAVENREELTVTGPTSFVTRVLQAKSTRHFFSGLEFAIEVKGGMNGPDFINLGSPVFRASGKLVGFMSRYYLMYRPGLSTYVRRWVPSTKAKNFGYVVLPADFAAKWVNHVLRSGRPSNYWQVDLSRQMRGEYALKGPGLGIAEGPAPKEEDLEGEGPIGGMDGVGIGGIDTAFSLHRISFFPVSGDARLLPASLRRLGQGLKEEKILTLSFRGEPNPFRFEPLRVYSLDSFLAQSGGDLRIFTKRKNQEKETGKAGELVRWVEALEEKKKNNWSYRWREIKESPRVLSAFYRCIFYLAWLKSEDWEKFPVAEWSKEFDPKWEESTVSVGYFLGTTTFSEWEKIWSR